MNTRIEVANMSRDAELQQDVMQELQWIAMHDGGRIHVDVKDGLVVLRGTVCGDAWRNAAIGAAGRIANCIDSSGLTVATAPAPRSDADILRAALAELHCDSSLPDDIRAEVRNGWVQLTGDVQWQFERGAAERAVRFIPGVKGVTNLIEVHGAVSTLNGAVSTLRGLPEEQALEMPIPIAHRVAARPLVERHS